MAVPAMDPSRSTWASLTPLTVRLMVPPLAPSKRQARRQLAKASDLAGLLEEAKRSGKVLIVELSSPHCHYCKKMDRDVFADPEIRRMLARDFILAVLNVEETTLPPVLEKAYRHITPSFFFLSPEGALIASYPGSWTKADFASILRENRRGAGRK